MADTPETMPERWTPEFLAEDHSKPIVISAAVFIVLNTVLVLLRAVGRRIQNLGWNYDDLFICFSWLLNIGLCICDLRKYYPPELAWTRITVGTTCQLTFLCP